MRTMKRMAALLLALMLVLSWFPAASVFAAELPETAPSSTEEAPVPPTTGVDPPAAEETEPPEPTAETAAPTEAPTAPPETEAPTVPEELPTEESTVPPEPETPTVPEELPTEESTVPPETETPTAPEEIPTEGETEPASEATEAPTEPEEEPTSPEEAPTGAPEETVPSLETGIYEEYILSHMDDAYVGQGDTLTPFDIIGVKQTLADGSVMEANGMEKTLAGLWADADGDGYADHSEAFLTQKGTDVLLYQVDENAEYLVGYVDTLNASSFHVADHQFAVYNNQGETVTGCVYDYGTGLVYVPVSQAKYVNDQGDLVLARIQIQLLYVSGSGTTRARAASSGGLFSSSVQVEVIPADREAESTVSNQRVSLMDTYMALKVSDGEALDIAYVSVNGCPISQEQWAYTDSDGTLLISIPPASVDTVSVVLRDPQAEEASLGETIGAMGISTQGAYGTTMDNLTTYYKDTWTVQSVPVVGATATIGLTVNGYTCDNTADVVTTYGHYAMTDGYYGSYANGGAINPTQLIGCVLVNNAYYYPGQVTSSWEAAYGDGLYWLLEIPAGTYTLNDGSQITIPEDFAGCLDCAHVTLKWWLPEGPPGGGANLSSLDPRTNRTRLRILDVRVSADGKSGSMMVGFATPTASTQAGTGAYLIKWEFPQTDEKFTLVKSANASAACMEQLKGNAMYSVAGAEYQVFVDGKVQETITTDASGKVTSSKGYAVDTEVTLKETKAPPGFKLDTTAHTFTIQAGENIFTVQDVPVFDPPFAITKVDKDTTKPQGNSSFSGAVFKFEYFDNTTWAGSPKRTWYFQTDAHGQAHYETSYLAKGYSNDTLYVGSNGTYQLPLGTVKITEIKNSLGYTVISTPLFCSIVEDPSAPDGAKTVWTAESWKVLVDMASGNYGVYEPIDTKLFGSLTIDKVDSVTGSKPQGEATLAGAKFHVINKSTNPVKIGAKVYAPGQVCYILTTDANGHASTGAIFPIGKYAVKEASVPKGYTLNTTWEKTFTVTKDQREFSFTASNACPDKVIRGGLRIVKQDAALGANTGSNSPLAGISFSVITCNDNPVVVNGVTYKKNDTVLTMEIKWNGSRWMAETAPDALPYGIYTLRENPASPGSDMANPYYALNPTEQTVQIRDNLVVVEKTFTNTLHPAEIRVEKVNSAGTHLAGAKFLLEWSEDGNTWSVVTKTESGKIVKGGCSSADLVDGTLTTPGSGVIAFEGLYPSLFYRLTEVEAPDGCQRLDGPVFQGKLPKDLTLRCNVSNAPEIIMPMTGAYGPILACIGAALVVGCVVFLIPWKKRKKN